jgi:hypothetical protein
MTLRCGGTWSALILLASCCSMPASTLGSIQGAVRNGTSGKPAIGDVVLLMYSRSTPTRQNEPSENTKIESQTKTDGLGKFVLPAHDEKLPHFVRVIHQGVDYDQKCPKEGSLNFEVFEKASSVHRIGEDIEIVRIVEVDRHLHVSEMIDVVNGSNPPITKS